MSAFLAGFAGIAVAAIALYAYARRAKAPRTPSSKLSNEDLLEIYNPDARQRKLPLVDEVSQHATAG